MDLTHLDMLVLLGIGAGAGLLGGMLGIGGSIIMIPAMAAIFDGRHGEHQHLYQAAAMVVNVFVAAPAARRHAKHGAVQKRVFRILLPATAIAIVFGVLLSNQLSGESLRLVFAVFLLWVVSNNLRKAIVPPDESDPARQKATPLRLSFVGGVTGGAAGLLGIGGGGICVPLAHVVCKLPMRQAIGASAAVMIVSAAIGSTFKLVTLSETGESWRTALLIALCLAPTALVTSGIGAELTHRLPIRVVRFVFAAVMLLAALRMGGLL
ncbi:MAG: sulfite exporter TauE/SafE family protein [Planctomycetota bacterium]